MDSAPRVVCAILRREEGDVLANLPDHNSEHGREYVLAAEWGIVMDFHFFEEMTTHKANSKIPEYSSHCLSLVGYYHR